MEIPVIVASGVLIQRSLAVGYFDVRVWFRCTAGIEVHEESFDRLTWLEACDVIDMELGSKQPGYELYSDGWQPTLWSS